MTENSLIGQAVGPDGRFVLKRFVGQGGSGEVYEAKDLKHDRSIAIKFLREFANDPVALQRFKDEGRKFSRVRHRGVVRVFGMSTAQGRPFIATEFVCGRDLLSLIRDQGKLAPQRALEIAHALARALEAVHDEGIVHRDVKPENVLIEKSSGRIVLIDFGVAKDLNASVSLTIDGQAPGTPGYTSPEQIRGQEIDHRSDIFALGVLFYEMVTGELPFEAASTGDVLVKTLDEAPLNPSRINEEVDRPVAQLIAQMIAKSRKARCGSAAEVAERIENILATWDSSASGEDSSSVVEYLRRAFSS